jgi:hypothetical protein
MRTHTSSQALGDLPLSLLAGEGAAVLAHIHTKLIVGNELSETYTGDSFKRM